MPVNIVIMPTEKELYGNMSFDKWSWIRNMYLYAVAIKHNADDYSTFRLKNTRDDLRGQMTVMPHDCLLYVEVERLATELATIIKTRKTK